MLSHRNWLSARFIFFLDKQSPVKVIGYMRLVMLIVVLVPFSGCHKVINQINHISIDFPHGETRLHVNNKGEASLYYGALPKALKIKRGAFDIQTIYKNLQSRVEPVVTNDKMKPGISYGMVTISFNDNRKIDYFITDREFAKELFQMARDNLIDKEQRFFIRSD